MKDGGLGIDGYAITTRRQKPMHESGHGVGEFHILHRRAGKVIDEWKVRNLVVNTGLNALVQGPFGTAVTGFKYIAIGNPSAPTATAYGTTALEAELGSGVGCGRTLVTVTVAVFETSKYRASFAQQTWTYTGTGTTVKEIGIFNAATAGTMFSRVSSADGLTWTGTTLATNDQISVTYTYTQSAGTPTAS